jgi:hypothetical protein
MRLPEAAGTVGQEPAAGCRDFVMRLVKRSYFPPVRIYPLKVVVKKKLDEQG